jgi:hypothetical protein
MKNKTSSIIYLGSIFAVSIVLLGGVIPLHNTLLTVSAIILTVFNGIVSAKVISERGRAI